MASEKLTIAVIAGGAAPGPVTTRLEAAGATVVRADGTSEGRVVESCADADVVMVFGLAPFGRRAFEALPRLKYIQQCTVGYDRIDVAAATEHGVMVANSPLFCLEEVSDHAVMLMMGCLRKLSHQLHAAGAAGWDRQAAVERMGPIYRMRGKTVGFVAFGKIARLTAEKLSGFGLRYLAYDPFLKPEQVRQWKVELVTLEELCRQSDFISMHALLNDDTRHMFGAAQFRAMKPTAYFVNTSRGATVDEAALIEALREGRIAGAGLDVMEHEPPAPDNPLLAMPNVLWTPHTAGYSVDAQADNVQQTTDEVLRVLAGEPPHALVNREVLANARLKLPVRA
jgi:D-3-phosphoglycerate dehydrogenase / 2-oxoglutarate reductase